MAASKPGYHGPATSFPESPTWHLVGRLWGRLCSPVNGAGLSHLRSWQEFPVSQEPDGLEIADQNFQIRPRPWWGTVN